MKLDRLLKGIAVLLFCYLTSGRMAQGVQLAWDANKEPDIAGYYLTCADGTNTTRWNTGTNTSLVVTNVKQGVTYSFTVTAFNAAGLESSPSAPVQYTVPTTQQAPLISASPAAQTVLAGSSFSLGVIASGSGTLQYKWFRNGSEILGLNTNKLAIAAAQTSDAGNYYAVVLNTMGSATSAVATVTVVTRPAITTQPVSQSVIVGSQVTLSVRATGSNPLAYQWFKGGSAFAGATSASLLIASVQSADAASYYVVVTNAAGSVTSATATITLITPPVISASPVSQTVVHGAGFSLSVAASGSGPLQYKWFHNDTEMAGGNTNIVVVAAAQAIDGGNYYATVSNSAGTATSTVASVTILTPPAITSQPTSQIVTAGASVTLSVQATGSNPLTYQWFRAGSALAGATSPSLVIASAQTTNMGSYYVLVTNAAGSATSATATLSLVSSPVVTSDPASQTANAGSSVTFSVKATGSNPLLYQWFRNGLVLSTATNSSLLISSAQTNDAGVYYVSVANQAGSTTSANATLNVLSSLRTKITGTNNGKSGKGGGSTSTAYLSAAPGKVVISPLAPAAVVIQMVGSAGKIYDIQMRDDWDSTGWVGAASVVAADDGLVEIVTTDRANYAQRFYRAVSR